MNLQRERRENREHLSYFDRRGHKVIEVESRMARYEGERVSNLSGFKKRKFENALFLEEQARTTRPIKILYR